jgi:hypothetical protein
MLWRLRQGGDYAALGFVDTALFQCLGNGGHALCRFWRQSTRYCRVSIRFLSQWRR